MNCAGISAESLRIRLSAGRSRICIASKARTPSRSITISPSSAESGANSSPTARSGGTQRGQLLEAPFAVVLLSLRQRAPFVGFVDVLGSDGVGYGGRATFRGRGFGKFELKACQRGGQVTSEGLKEQVVEQIDEAYA